MPHYAWTNILAGTAEKPVRVSRSEQVSQEKLGISAAEWQALIDAGSVREKKFPAPKNYQGSAVDFIREQLLEATSMSAIEEEEAVSELAKVSEGGSNKK